MSYQIITDSGCDFTKEKYEALGLIAAPLTVNFRGETYPDRNDDSLRDMYADLRTGEVATTSAVNPEQWQEIMEPLLEKGEDILVLTFSSGLSTTYQSASIAAQELRERYPERTISVVDSLCASLGQGLLKAGRGPEPWGAGAVAAGQPSAPVPLVYGGRLDVSQAGRPGQRGHGNYGYHAEHQACAPCGQ